MSAARFSRTEALIGPERMAALRAARIAVAGLGAVGSYAVEALARMGAGALVIVDFDRVRPSNANRQLFALESTMGALKADVAAARIADIDPECCVEALHLFLDEATIPRLLARAPDVVVDAIDSLGPKVALLAAAVHAGVPIVSSMGAATRTDPACVRVGDISQTVSCPLARLIRKQLRRRGIHAGVTAVYSTEAPRRHSTVVAPPEAYEDDALDRGRQRRPLGSISYLTGLFGLLAAREAANHLFRARGLPPL